MPYATYRLLNHFRQTKCAWIISLAPRVNTAYCSFIVLFVLFFAKQKSSDRLNRKSFVNKAIISLIIITLTQNGVALKNKKCGFVLLIVLYAFVEIHRFYVYESDIFITFFVVLSMIRSFLFYSTANKMSNASETHFLRSCLNNRNKSEWDRDTGKSDTCKE